MGSISVNVVAHGLLTVVAMYSAFLLFQTLGLDPLLASIPIAAVFFGLGYLLQSLLINPFIGRPEHEQFILLVGLAILIVNGLLMIFGPDARPVSLAYGFDSYLVGPLMLDQVRDRDPGLRRQSHRRGRGGLERQAALRADVRHRARLRRCRRRADGDHRRCGAGPRLGLHPARLHHRHHRRAGIDGRRAPGRRAHRGLRGAGGVLRRALAEKHVLVRPVDRGAGAAPARPARTPRVSALWADTPLRGRVLAAVLLAAFLAAPLIADRYLISVLILVLYFAYVGQAWNLLMGFAGQLSLGHALYLGIGAYVAAALWIHFGIGPWLGVFAAIPIAALAGAFIGWLGWRF